MIVRVRKAIHKVALVSALAGAALFSGAGAAHAESWHVKGTYYSAATCKVAGKTQWMKTKRDWKCAWSSDYMYHVLWVWY